MFLKKSEIISRFTEPFKLRPLVPTAVSVLICAVLYVNLIFKWPTSEEIDWMPTDSEYCGKIREINLDSDGNVQSFVIGEMVCYVNKLSGVSDFNEVYLGSKAFVSGEFHIIEKPMNPGEFDRRKYYGAKKIYMYCNAEEIYITKLHRKCIKDYFSEARNTLTQKVNEHCRYESGTVNAIILGDKSSVDQERKNLYSDAGVGHFLVISGLHISAFGTFFYKLLRRTGIGVKCSCYFSILIILLYGILVGFTISVIRALVMFSVRLFADVVKKPYDMLSAVSFAMIVTLIINPFAILDSAFTYSYVTVFSISVYITHKTEIVAVNFFGEATKILGLPFFLCLTLMPVTLMNSFEYSVFSIIVNSLLVPASGVILSLAFLAFAFAVVGLGLPTKLFDFVLHFILKILDELCKLSKSRVFSFAGCPSTIRTILYYVLLALFFLFIKEKIAKHLRFGIIFSLLMFVGGFRLYCPSVSMLYVGQGECIVMKTGLHTALISDCGSSSERNIVDYKVLPFLKYLGITRIEGIFVSHADADHSGGINDLIEKSEEESISVMNVFLPICAKKDKKSAITDIAILAKTKGIPCIYLKKGNNFELSGFLFTCLSPGEETLSGDTNIDSLVFVASRGTFDILFTGDVTADIEPDISKSLGKITDCCIDLLKVSHHGSKTATSDELFDNLGFSYALISAGKNNRYGHPHGEVVDRLKKNGAKVYITYKDGCITIPVK